MNEIPLKDIHLPDISLWWPFAAGWWLILLLLIIAVITGPKLLAWLKYKPLRSLSLVELKAIQQRRLAGQREDQLVADISILIRRTVMSLDGREHTAGVSGEAWINLLKSMPGGASFTPDQLDLLAYGQYQSYLDCDVDALLQSCERWFNSLPTKDAHVSV